MNRVGYDAAIVLDHNNVGKSAACVEFIISRSNVVPVTTLLY